MYLSDCFIIKKGKTPTLQIYPVSPLYVYSSTRARTRRLNAIRLSAVNHRMMIESQSSHTACAFYNECLIYFVV